jgi:arylsulfatase A-like enzyme
MDILPTVATFAGARLPDTVVPDGHDVSALLFGQETVSPYDHFFYFRSGQLRGVRQGRWKLHVPHTYATLEGGFAGQDGQPGQYNYVPMDLTLFDLLEDPGETRNVAAAHPEVVDTLLALVDMGRQELGDRLTNSVGRSVRPPGRVQHPWSEQGTTTATGISK